MDWLNLLAVKGTLKSLLQHHSSKASILVLSAFFTVQFSHPYMTTGKTIALTRWTFVGKVMSLLFNMLSRLVMTFLPRRKHLLISWLQSPSAMILLEFQLQHQSFQWTLISMKDWFPLGWIGWIYLQSKNSQKSSLTPQFKSISSSALSFLYSPTLTSIHDYWKNHSFD